METLTRLVTESLARHGFDRPVDYRRLQWSRWFRCESHHSLLVVPSKPGIFALAEEVMDLGSGNDHVQTAASPALSMAEGAVSRALREAKGSAPLPAAEVQRPQARRMLAVTQFFEDEDMAFTLDRMLSHQNPMRARLASGRYFVRFVAIEDPTQRRSICGALNQWIVSSAEKATGIGSHFATSLEFTHGAEQNHLGTAALPALSVVEGAVQRTLSVAKESGAGDVVLSPQNCDEIRPTTTPRLNSAVATTIHCSSSFPSGF
jgi:hypothetical protein